MPASAWVSTSSVTKTLVTASRCINGTDSLSIRRSSILIQPDAIMPVPGRHVRQNYSIPNLQPVHDLDRVHGAAAQRHRHARRSLAVRIDLEQGNLAVRLPEYRATHIDHVRQVFELDGAIHA